MFGYVRPEKPDLLMRDFTLYKAIYCGLCKAISRRCGQLPRFSVSYDMTFLSLLLLAFSTVEPEIIQESCILNPLKKKPIIAEHPVLDYTADLSCLLAFESMRDDAQDDKPIRGRALSLLFRRSAKRIEKLRPSVALAVREGLAKLGTIEKGPPSLEAADCFGEILSAIFKDGFEELTASEKSSKSHVLADQPVSGAFGEERETLSEADSIDEASWHNSENMAELYATLLADAGRALGRWVYLMDAFDDLEDDMKKGNWNPLSNFEDSKSKVEPLLIDAEESVDRNLALLSYERFGSLVYNIVTVGLPTTRHRIINGEPLPKV